MKKTIMTSLFLLFSFGIFAQNQVRISYVSPDSIPSATLDLMDFLDIKYMKMKIHGDIKGKKWQLWVNESHEGKITSKSLFPYAFEFSDTLATFVFIAQDQNDTLTLVCKTPRYSMPKTKYAINMPLTQFAPICLLCGYIMDMIGEEDGRGCKGVWKIADGARCIRESEMIVQ